MPSFRSWSASVLFSVLTVAGYAPDVRADPTRERYTEYEQETIDAALERQKAVVDPSPEGKKIGRIDIEVLDVIEERDPAPNFLNYLHATSKEYTVRRSCSSRRVTATTSFGSTRANETSAGCVRSRSWSSFL